MNVMKCRLWASKLVLPVIKELPIILMFFLFIKANLIQFFQNNDLDSFWDYFSVFSIYFLYAYFIAAAVGYTVSFIMNRKVTFDADSGLTSSVIMYIIMVVATVFIAAWMKAFFTDFAVNHFGEVNKFGDLIIFILVTTIPFLWTYPLQRFVIHRKHNIPAEGTAEDTAEVQE